MSEDWTGMCSTCHATGHLFGLCRGSMEWWPCPACGGAGVRALFAPPSIGPGTRRKDKR